MVESPNLRSLWEGVMLLFIVLLLSTLACKVGMSEHIMEDGSGAPNRKLSHRGSVFENNWREVMWTC
jgi:hypothetical protein